MTARRDFNERSNSMFATALGCAALLIGLLLLLGPTHGPTNYVLAKFAALDVWGAAFLLAGGCGLAGQVGRRRVLIVGGHALGCLLAAVVAGCFYVASGLPEGQASLHPAGAYLGISVMHLLAAMVSRPPR